MGEQGSKEVVVNLSTKEKKQIEEDVFDIIGVEAKTEQPVVLDLEAIRILLELIILEIIINLIMMN